MSDEAAPGPKKPERSLRSFYDFRTTFHGGASAKKVEKVKSVRLHNSVESPTYENVVSSYDQHGIHEKRITELKTRGVTYSRKADADTSNSISLGIDKVGINWNRDLPPIKSKYGSIPDSSIKLRPGKTYLLKRIHDPPSFDSVLEWCETHGKVEKPPLEPSQGEEDEETDLNKTCVRIRQNSEDSIGSELSMSPPSSPLKPETEVIGKTMILPNPIPSQKKNDSLMISGGQVTGSSKSDRQNTLHGIKEANDYYHFTIFSTEIFVATRQNLYPDPEFDQVTAIFYVVFQEGPKQNSYGIITMDPNVTEKRNFLQISGSHFEGDITIVQTETDLFDSFVSLVKEECPDVLVGYETQRSSYGYLCRRASYLNINLASKLSRMPNSTSESRFSGPNG